MINFDIAYAAAIALPPVFNVYVCIRKTLTYIHQVINFPIIFHLVEQTLSGDLGANLKKKETRQDEKLK